MTYPVHSGQKLPINGNPHHKEKGMSFHSTSRRIHSSQNGRKDHKVNLSMCIRSWSCITLAKLSQRARQNFDLLKGVNDRGEKSLSQSEAKTSLSPPCGRVQYMSWTPPHPCWRFYFRVLGTNQPKERFIDQRNIFSSDVAPHPRQVNSNPPPHQHQPSGFKYTAHLIVISCYLPLLNNNNYYIFRCFVQMYFVF